MSAAGPLRQAGRWLRADPGTLTGAGLAKGILFLAGVALFLPLWVQSGQRGLGSGDYSHVFLIPVIAGVLYLARKPAERRPAQTMRPALALWIIGIGLRVLGEFLRSRLLAQAGFPFVLIGSVGMLFGRDQAKRITFVAVFLLFSFGFVSELMLLLFAKALILLSAGAAYDAVTTFIPSHGPFLLQQHKILTPTVRYDVVEACSGTRGLVSLYVVGTCVGWYSKLSPREWRRFFVLLFAVGAGVNILRICITIITSVLFHDRFGHDGIHEFWNLVLFGLCMLSSLMLADLARRQWRLPGIVTLAALVLVFVHGLTVTFRAAEGSHQMLVGHTPDSQTLAIQAHPRAIPSAMVPYVSAGTKDDPRWLWIFTSGFVHLNLMHLIVNVVVMILLAHGLHGRIGRWAPGLPLLAGQILGSSAGWLAARNDPDPYMIFMGASGAVSGLFGAYLFLLAAARRIPEGLFFASVYAIGLVLTKISLPPTQRLAVMPHLAAVLAGLFITMAWVWISACDKKIAKPVDTPRSRA